MDSLHILWINRSFTPNETGVKPHCHPYYHMFAVLSGSLEFVVDETPVTLAAGECIVVPKNTRHSYFNTKPEAVEALEVKFTIKAKTLAAELDRLTLPLSNEPLLCPLIDKMVSEYEAEGSAANDAAKSYLGAALRLITEKARYERKDADTPFSFPEASDLTKKIVAWLEEHYKENFSLEALAKELSFNKTYLCAAFKKDTDLTILDCLNLIRIRKAAEMISYSEYSIAQVAEMTGFGSASTFNHVFQKYIGTTPLQMRKAYPNGILLESGGDIYSKSKNPKRYLFNALAGKRIS